MEKPSFHQALKFWLKLGFISFGGPAGQIAIMHEFLVEKKKWISEGRFLHALNYCMMLPGPEAQQMATYIGWMLHGIRGGLAAGLLFILPSMFILFILCSIYVTYGQMPIINAMFEGIKPAIIAIVILAMVKIGKKSLHNYLHYCIAMIAFIGIYFFEIPFPLIIIGTIFFGLFVLSFYPKFIAGENKKSNDSESNEEDYYINKNTKFPNTGFEIFRVLKQVFIGFIFWVLPFLVFYYVTADFNFWKQLIFFFTKAALVTFGGAYAVLPYVAQISVEHFKWLTNSQMIDGLALGESTPGPLIMVLVFVGFMAGYHHFGNSILMGSLGLVTTTFYTFLPSFLFIFIGAPIIEKTQANKKIKDILSLVTASVVGVVLNLTIYFSMAVLFPKEMSFNNFEWILIIWIIISLFALQYFKTSMILWIGMSAVFGMFKYFVGK